MIVEEYPPNAKSAGIYFKLLAIAEKAKKYLNLACLANPDYTEREKKLVYERELERAKRISMESDKKELLQKNKELEKEIAFLNYKMNHQGKLTKERGQTLLDYALSNPQNNTGDPRDTYVVLDKVICVKILQDKGLMSKNVRNPHKLVSDAMSWSVKLCQERGIFAEKKNYIARRAECLLIKPNIKVPVRRGKETIKDKIKRMNENKSHPDFKNHPEPERFTTQDFFNKWDKLCYS